MAESQKDRERALPRTLGRYTLYEELAAGGIGSVCLARMRGESGFSRVMAVKRLHRQYARDPHFVTMFLDEARLAARVRHPNVVSTDDVVSAADELYLVMEYVPGESLSRLLSAVARTGARVEPAIAVAIMAGVLEGLNAAHGATNEQGVPLHIVHRDISPQNVMIGVDGVARVIDFGIAKALGRHQETTQSGHVKGKLSYMAPEQLSNGKLVDRRTDLWAASVLFWEMIVGKRLFPGPADALRFHGSSEIVVLPSALGVPDVFDEIIRKGLSREMDQRFQTARDMLTAIEGTVAPAPARRVAQWVQKFARDALAMRAAQVKEIERDAASATESPSTSERTIPVPPYDEASPPIAENATQTARSPRLGGRGALALALLVLVGAAGAAALYYRYVPRARAPLPTAVATREVAPRAPAVGSSAEEAPLASAKPTAGATEAAKPPVLVGRPPPGVTARPPKLSCDPPYTLEPGTERRKYKRECLQ